MSHRQSFHRRIKLKHITIQRGFCLKRTCNYGLLYLNFQMVSWWFGYMKKNYVAFRNYCSFQNAILFVNVVLFVLVYVPYTAVYFWTLQTRAARCFDYVKVNIFYWSWCCIERSLEIFAVNIEGNHCYLCSWGCFSSFDDITLRHQT